MEKSESVALLLDFTSELVRAEMHDLKHIARIEGITLLQMNVLVHLYFQGASEMNHLCGTMDNSPAGTSQMIERLAQQGLVKRLESTEDRRIRLVDLTKKGKKLVETSNCSRTRRIEKIIGSLSSEEQAQFLDLIRRITDRSHELDFFQSCHEQNDVESR